MAWLIPLLPILVAPALAVAGRGTEASAGRRRLALLAACAMLGTAALAAAAVLRGWTGSLPWIGPLALHLDFAPADAPVVPALALLVPAVAAPVLVYAAWHEATRGLGRLMATLAMFVGAMELVAGAADLLTLIVGWELVGACSAILVAHQWWEGEKPRAGAVVFLTTRAGDLGLFLAAAAAFAGTGSLGYDALTALDGFHLHLVVAGVLVAAAAKSAQLPFAPWLFAAMKGPVSVSTLLHSATMVAAGVFLLVRLHPVLDTAPWFGATAMAVGLATALGAGIVAVLQPHAKRLLAGSTSAHYGLMFVAVGAGYPAIATLHLVAHALAKAPLFLASGIAEACTGSYRLEDMGLRRVLPGVAVASGVAAAAIAGIPPLGAGWSKEKVVAAAGHVEPWLVALVALAGALSAAYMARFQLQAFGDGEDRCQERTPQPAERWPLYLLAGATSLLFVLWIPSLRGALVTPLGEVPGGTAWETVLSLALLGLGVAAGAYVAHRRPWLGTVGAAERLADWLAIPAAARVVIVRPGFALARGLARFDDAAVDGGVRLSANVARTFSAALARVDDRVVDGGVRAAAAVARGLAWLGRRVGEGLMDGVPEGVSSIVGLGGRQARRLQTGLAHHYYSLIVAGLAIGIVLLILGG